MNKITLLTYELYVTTDIIHDWGRTIPEFCSPELGLFINEECVFVSEAKDTKYRLKQAKKSSKVLVSTAMAEKLRELAEAIKNRDSLSKKMQEDLFKGRRVAERLSGEK